MGGDVLYTPVHAQSSTIRANVDILSNKGPPDSSDGVNRVTEYILNLDQSHSAF
jgi:hypothetical protein